MTAWRRRFDECRVAVMLLTRLPVGRSVDDVPSLKAAAWAFPLVGVPLGILGWLAFQGALGVGLPQSLAAIAVLASNALFTGALHHDGLADLADGLFGGNTVERRLEIMRDSRIGSYGVLALILVLATIGVAIAEANAASLSVMLFIHIAAASRLCMLIALCLLPPARSDGLGRISATPTLASAVVGAILCTLTGIASGWPGFAVTAAMALVALIVGVCARRKIGGQTGDVLGAVALSAETAGWLGFILATAS